MDYKWYILNVVSGQENKICNEINDRIAEGSDKVREAFVPVKRGWKYVRGKKVEDLQKVFPGYVFVNVHYDPETHALLRSVPKSLGFLGQKNKPEPVPEAQVEKLRQQAETPEVVIDANTFSVGDIVKIMGGPFESFTGTVEALEPDKNLLKISVSIFGRATMVDIAASQVEKV